MQDQSEGWNRDPLPAIDSKVVLLQLDRMLKSRHFRASRRYPAFLNYIVRHRLEGDIESLKERILGIEVFKRPHDYDTSADPVVRITAGEVRKRIALYYHDEGTGHELRIELPAGSYVPVFSAGASAVAAQQEASLTFPAIEANPVLDEVGDEAIAHRGPARPWVLAAAVGLMLSIIAAASWYWMWRSSALQSMWLPFFHSPDPVMVVVGTPLGRLAGPSENGGSNFIQPMDSHSHEHLALTDALALIDATGLLKIHHQNFRVQTAGATSLDDVRKRPVILIAAFGNQWSGRILAPLRFSLLRQQVAADGTTILGSIVDHRHPGSQWNFDFTKPVTVNSKDYAIVARLHSDLTEGPVMVIAGLGPSATESAGEFVATPEYLEQIGVVAPSNWRNKNLELVLEVPVIDGKAGHARIVASEFW